MLNNAELDAKSGPENKMCWFFDISIPGSLYSTCRSDKDRWLLPRLTASSRPSDNSLPGKGGGNCYNFQSSYFLKKFPHTTGKPDARISGPVGGSSIDRVESLHPVQMGAVLGQSPTGSNMCHRTTWLGADYIFVEGRKLFFETTTEIECMQSYIESGMSRILNLANIVKLSEHDTIREKIVKLNII